MKPLFVRILTAAFLLISFPSIIYSQASCATAFNLTPSLSCSTTSGDLKNAVGATPAPTCGTGTAYSVWYKFTALSPSTTVTINNFANGIQSAPYIPYLEIFSGTCGSFTSLSCQQATSGGSGSASITLTTLTTGTIYYIRVYTTTQRTSGNNGFDICAQSSPNDGCLSAVSLTSATSCSNTAGSLILSTPSSGLPSGCEAAGTHYDVWYSFVAASTTHTITISSLGTSFTNPEIQLYSGACGALTSIQCGVTSLTATGLTISNTYYIRVSNIGSVPVSNGGFNICVTYPPSNDDCANAINLYSSTTCTNTSSTLASATASAGIPLGCASAGTYYDVWFTFAAANVNETITLSSMTGISSPAIQLYSGSCGTLTSVACSATSTLAATGLSVGTTYYIRVSNYNAAATSTGNFNICITHAAPATSAIDYGKSYVNISKNSGGGTINPGDTLEVRGTLVIRSGSGLDSLSFLDTLHLGGGVRLVPGSISLRTNEGKVYKSLTDATGDDAGYYYTSGTDTVIRINFGAGASATARGRLLNTSRPSVFGSTCIIMATYRVVVYAGYGTTLGLGGGKITTKDIGTGTLGDLSFSARNAIVYSSPGLCPNAVAATNAIGGDNNGTFGTGTTQNRAPSPNVTGYTYSTFQTSNPQDYYYGIANNTSAGGTSFTTVTTWAKPDNSSPTHRVFNFWDITGDHTGATNTSKGNPPCDPSKPISSTNPCGYMLIVNSAYKTDTAFQYAVTNLCPNTYYEISSWIKNICYKCGCDSNGVAATGAGYIPSALNDSSGVQPNITFDINGVDYYTTGNITYGGLSPSTQTGSDSNNTWVKRGFTYLTGTSQSSLTLTIRNNAPGGGGNDWALDDISLATCLPNMSYSPSLAPAVCDSNTISINDTIRSYFNNYANYKWQRSTNNGSTWNDIAGASGVASPAWNGSAYQYISSYTVPPAATNLTDSGNMYRVVVATTSSNLSSSSCQTTDGISIITLSVIDCGIVLNTDMLSLNGKLISNHSQLLWSTSKENEPVIYDIEKSFDGINFNKIGSINGYNDNKSEVNHYSFTDPAILSGKGWYRIAIKNNNSGRKYSQTIKLSDQQIGFGLGNIINPFKNALSFEITATYNTKIDVILTDLFGKTVKQKSYNIYSGVNGLTLDNTQGLSPGIYALQVKNGNTTINSKVLKR